MKVDRLETHDRFLEFGKQSDMISRGCEDCIQSRPEEFENHPFYIFAHKREIGMDEKFNLFVKGGYNLMEQVPTHRLIWQPRLSKPEPQINSMLFKYYPIQDFIKVIWIIPEPETWDQFTKGKMIENNLVCESINSFKNDKKKMEEKELDDLSEETIKCIYSKISKRKPTSKIEVL